MLNPSEIIKRIMTEQGEVWIYRDKVTGDLCHVAIPLQGENQKAQSGIATFIDPETNMVNAQGPVSISTRFGVTACHITGEWKEYNDDGFKTYLFKNNFFAAGISWNSLRNEYTLEPYDANHQRPVSPLNLTV
jgi:hypothetical protein